MSKLLYPEEHLSCARYDSGNSPIVEYILYPQEYAWEKLLTQTEIVFVLEGDFSVTYEHFLNLKVGKGNIIILPPGCHYRARTEGGCTAFVFRLSEIDHFCDNFTLERLAYEMTENKQDIHLLDIRSPVEYYLSELRHNYLDGLRCSLYHELKIKEFFYLLRAYYNKKELAGFFRPLLSNNTRFTNFVLQNYKKVKTVNELAALYNSSVSSFDKKFRMTFGISPYKWMMQKKISVLYNELNTTTKPLKQIAKEQNFSSLPQFTDYCKKHFGYSPSKMRRLAGMGLINGINAMGKIKNK